MVLSVATKVFVPEIELANRYGSLARVARRHLIDLSPQAWKASCRMRETTASRGALGTFRTAAGKCCLDMLGVFAAWRASVAEGGARRPRPVVVVFGWPNLERPSVPAVSHVP